MKNITRTISLVLASLMLALCLASCSATDSDRVSAAMLKMIIAKKTDCTASLNVSISAGDKTTELPMSVVIKKDCSSAYDPLVYMELSGTGIRTKAYYKGGYLYCDTYGVKTKAQMSYEEMKRSFANVADITAVFDAKQKNIDESFVITANDDGTLTVKMTVTAQEFAEKLADFSAELASGLGKDGTVEVSDTVFEFTVDKTNSISSVKADMDIKVTSYGKVTEISYSMDFRYNPIGEGFKVPEPTNLGAYTAA